MKTKYFLLGISTLLFMGSLWFGHAVWRAHRQLVTLDLHNALLGEVLRKIESQTWQKIRAEKGLDARITLHVKNKPLSYVLDRLAEQTGARWSTLYAVFSSSHALKALDSTLQSDGKLEPAGWTKIAPSSDGLELPKPGEAGPVIRTSPAADGPGPDFDLPPGPRARIMIGRDSNGDNMVVQSANGEVQVWSPAELVVESKLKQQLVSSDNTAPTAQAAKEAAQRVNGKWTTYLAFRKSIMGIGFAPPTQGRPEQHPFRRDPNERFARLTPEQRVLQARQRLQFSEK